jgi:hypothetical protein
MAAGLHGELYVSVWDLATQSERVLRVDPSGAITTIASGLQATGEIVVDAFGDLIVGLRGDSAGLWRISPSGTRSPIADVPLDPPFDPSLAVGPDGDLWVGTEVWVMRLGPTGAPKLRFQTSPAVLVSGISVSPSGEPYFGAETPACPRGIQVLRGTTDECAFPNVFQSPVVNAKLAFDKDGDLLVGQKLYGLPPDSVRGWGHVDILSPGTAARSLAHVPHLTALTFMRDQQGNMTSRLVALQAGWASTVSRIVEINGAADRPVGAGFAVRFFHAALDSLPPATLGKPYNQTLHVTTDATSPTWSVEDGVLPSGLSLSAEGVLRGTPTVTGSFAFTARATNGTRSWFAPGTIRVFVDVSVAEATEALLGGPLLDQAKIEFLDQHGNKNGLLDIGDLRALLRAKGLLPPP